jgi:hypothetical protein
MHAIISSLHSTKKQKDEQMEWKEWIHEKGWQIKSKTSSFFLHLNKISLNIYNHFAN